MNGYFWIFAAYALMITPVALHVRIRIGREMRWRVKLQLAGLPFVRREQTQEKKVQAADVTSRLLLMDRSVLLSLLREGHLLRAARVFRLESLYVHARLSFEDAALTAISYAFIRTLLETLYRCGAWRPSLTGRVEADFHGRGSEMVLQGIFVCRLGTLAAAAIRLGMAILRTRARRSAAEEEEYAAASH